MSDEDRTIQLNVVDVGLRTFHICSECGALVVLTKQHDVWHRTIQRLVMRSG